MAKRHGALVYVYRSEITRSIECPVECGAVYRHRDIGQLEEQLSRCPTRHKIVVTETLFSMDGDFVDLRVRVIALYSSILEWTFFRPSSISNDDIRFYLSWMKRTRCSSLETLVVATLKSVASKIG